MESQCEYFMYFPAVPISDLSDPARYRTLPRRSHLYLGETVRFLLVLRSQNVVPGSGPLNVAGAVDTGGTEHPSSRSWRELADSLCAVASVCPGDGRQRAPPLYHDYHSSGEECVDDTDDEDAGDVGCTGRGGTRHRGFRGCKPLLIHNSPGNGSPADEPVVLNDEVIFPLTVSLDKLPVSTLKVKVRAVYHRCTVGLGLCSCFSESPICRCSEMLAECPKPVSRRGELNAAMSMCTAA
uniref:TRAPP14 N-terminal domain-containing protein n=1 Tax=Electrophorus electricus TaxID=8005 RepID=A0AAY5END9_ELEEL